MLMRFVSIVGLVMVLLAAVGYLAGSLEKEAMTSTMLAGTVIWFASAPFWMGNRSE